MPKEAGALLGLKVRAGSKLIIIVSMSRVTVLWHKYLFLSLSRLWEEE